PPGHLRRACRYLRRHVPRLATDELDPPRRQTARLPAGAFRPGAVPDERWLRRRDRPIPVPRPPRGIPGVGAPGLRRGRRGEGRGPLPGHDRRRRRRRLDAGVRGPPLGPEGVRRRERPAGGPM
ncbi:MAG: hypothetical protein AVDCRST_MAG70-1952, partial [uncultured Thermomicrobiales bacterium]